MKGLVQLTVPDYSLALWGSQGQISKQLSHHKQTRGGGDQVCVCTLGYCCSANFLLSYTAQDLKPEERSVHTEYLYQLDFVGSEQGWLWYRAQQY